MRNGPDEDPLAVSALEATAGRAEYKESRTAQIALENLRRMKADAELILAHEVASAYAIAIEWVMAADRMAWVDEGLAALPPGPKGPRS